MNPASSAPLPAGPPRGPAPARRRAAQSDPEETIGDRYVWAQGDRSKLELTLTFVGVMMFMFVVITYRMPIGDVAVATALLGMLVDKRGIMFPRFLLMLVAFLVWCWMGTFTTRFPGPASDATYQLAKTALIWWAALAAIRTRSQFRWAMIILVFLYATHPIRGGIMNILVYGHSVNGRAVWNQIFSNPNDYAVITLLFLSIAAGLAVTEKKGLVKYGAMASCLVFPVMILYTGSRANFLALGFFGLAIFTGQKKKARAAAMLAVVVAAGAFTVPASTWQRLGGVVSLGNEEAVRELDDSGSANERLEIWRVARFVVKNNLAAGTGFGTYEWAHHEAAIGNRDLFPYFYLRPTLRDAHSTYFTIMAETGLPGTMLWLGALGAVIAYAEKRRRRLGHLMPQAAKQLLYLEYGLAGYGIAAIWGSYATHIFLYMHLTWIWVAATMLEKDAKELRRWMATQGQGQGMQAPQPHQPQVPPGRPLGPKPRPAFDPGLVGFPARRDSTAT